MEDNNKLISIIIPAYNVEMYIEECLNSILKEKLNLEIIVVDDGSKDKTAQIIKEGYKNIKIISQKNKGPSNARKVGFLHSKGDYIVFIDSDDYIEQGYLEELYNKIEEEDVEIVIAPIKYYDGKNYSLMEEKRFDKKILESKEYICELLKGNCITSCSNKIYKRKVLKNSVFLDGVHYGEDCYTVVKTLLNSKKISFIESKSYIYRKNVASLTNKKRIPIESYSIIYNKIESELEKISELRENKYYFKYNFLYSFIKNKSILSKRIICDREYRKIFFEYLKDIKFGNININMGKDEKEKQLIASKKRGIISGEICRYINKLRKRVLKCY